MKRIRPIVVAIPGAVEKLSHGTPTFFTEAGRRGRTFASVHDERHYFEGRLCLWAAAPPGEQAALVEDRPERYFVPPYVGHRGWIGLRLDLAETDWDEVAGVIEDAYEFIAG